MSNPSGESEKAAGTYKFVDCHCHLLPYVDDGSNNPEQTKEAFRQLKQQGCVGCVLTPHMGDGDWWFADPDQILNGYDALRSFDPVFPVKLGAEVNVKSVSRAIEGLRGGTLFTMAGTSIVLTEFEPNAEFNFIIYGVNKLRREGYTAVLAHPERLDAFRTHPERLGRLAEQGVSVQINAYSLVREQHENVRLAAREALRLGIVRYLGFDSHPPNRWPLFEDGLRYIYENCTKEYGDSVCFGNASNDFFGEGC